MMNDEQLVEQNKIMLEAIEMQNDLIFRLMDQNKPEQSKNTVSINSVETDISKYADLLDKMVDFK